MTSKNKQTLGSVSAQLMERANGKKVKHCVDNYYPSETGYFRRNVDSKSRHFQTVATQKRSVQYAANDSLLKRKDYREAIMKDDNNMLSVPPEGTSRLFNAGATGCSPNGGMVTSCLQMDEMPARLPTHNTNDTLSSDSCFSSQEDSASPFLSRDQSMKKMDLDEDYNDENEMDEGDRRIRLNISGTIFEVCLHHSFKRYHSQ